MSFTIAGVDRMLETAQTDITLLSLHDGFPDDTGSNEHSGGSPAYARQPVTWASVNNRVFSLSAPVVFDTAQDVWWIGGWDAGGDMLARWPANGIAHQYAVDLANNLIWIGQGGAFSVDDQVVFYGDGFSSQPPQPLTEQTIYWALDSGAMTRLSATQGGSEIDLTVASAANEGSGVVSIITPNLGGQREVTISQLTLHGRF